MNINDRYLIAIDNIKIYGKLKEKKLNICNNDIFYKEGVLEYLERNKNIDYIILNPELNGEISIEELIKNINKINENIKIILTKDKKDIEVYKKLNNEEELLENFGFTTKEKKYKNIAIFGINGIGKTVISSLLAKNIKNKKVLLIEYKKKKYDLYLVLKIKKENDKIIKINKNLYFLSVNKMNDFNIEKEMENYDVIIVDTSTEEIELNKYILNKSDKVLVIVGANELEIKKTINYFNIFPELKNTKEKIKIIFNKCTKYSLSDDILINIFNKFDLVCKIDYEIDFERLKYSNKKINKQIEKIKGEII